MAAALAAGLDAAACEAEVPNTEEGWGCPGRLNDGFDDGCALDILAAALCRGMACGCKEEGCPLSLALNMLAPAGCDVEADFG